METLRVLTEKVAQLVEKIKDLTVKNEQLLLDNEALNQKLSSMESALLNNNQNLDELLQEKNSTKHVVDDLIKSIDLLISNEH